MGQHYDDIEDIGFPQSSNSIDDVTPQQWNALRNTSRAYRKIEQPDSPSINNIDYKFAEDALIEEFKAYIDSTYNQHYAQDKIQATEVIIDAGHGTGFCIGNVQKYSKRYGKKGTPKDARKDLMKVLHYALIQLYIHDMEN